jgi:putative heme-binding domain-containing protein
MLGDMRAVILTLCVGVASVAAADPPEVAAPVRKARVKADPPALQMLVPGFSVRKLPVELTNLVNLQYRHDGVLVALGYNGNIWLVRDGDGDGLEDRADLFWEGRGKVNAPIGMDLAPKGTPHGDAVFFACAGKVMMVTDRDGDGRAEEARAIAEGWPPARAGVDTASVCYDARDGSVYFGLGVRWYDNAYELDEGGRAHNDLSSERGAILRLAPDFQSREKLCTGVRWPVGLRFNRLGDLFCTDQEGATWLPNGNPFDELLHIERGRHYGFPPRHPKHLPNVVDEPSVFDYGPQHQSTCGLRFNEPVNGGPAFGPAWWADDALITGESRGKLYRTRLAKTPQGYVAQNQIIACLNQLAVDVTVSPRGALLVATHSGDPDWGTGPEGPGTILVIEPEKNPVARPVAAWSDAPERLRVAFDRPLDPAAAQAITTGARLERGRHVQPGDRFETMWPGYEVVKRQHEEAVTRVPVLSATVSEDRRMVELTVPPQSSTDTFALTLGRPEITEPAGALVQEDTIDLAVTLNGVEAEWVGDDGSSWRGWLPHPDVFVAGHFTTGSAGHREALNERLSTPGRLTIKTRLDLWSMLRPAVQEGARLDHEPPAERVTVAFSSPTTEFTVLHGIGTNQKSETSKPGQVSHDVFLSFTPQPNQPIDITLACRTDKDRPPSIRFSWYTAEDERPRAFPLRRFLLPWARPELPSGFGQVAARPEVQGGDWARGREIFFSERALCGKCHAVRGHGATLAPDLSNLVSRDYASVHRDIADPNAAINPDYVAHEVTLKNGSVVPAVVRPAGSGRFVLGLGAGAEMEVAAEDIAARKPLATSIMPAKLDEALGARDFRDLMAFLLTEPPLMGVYAKDGRPAPRPPAEVAAAMAGAPSPADPIRPLTVVLVSGPKDHGPGEHDYPRWRDVWSRLFSLADQTTLMLADEWPSPEQWASADAVVFYRRGDWSLGRARDFDAFLRRGGGVVFVHWAVEAGAEAGGLAARIGLASNSAQTKYRHGPIEVVFDPAVRHPVARGLERLQFVDETYWNLVPNATGRPTILARAEEDGASHPQFWTTEPEGGGRVFVSIPGHYSWTFDDPLFRLILLRGLAWSSREPVDRFNPLVHAGLE